MLRYRRKYSKMETVPFVRSVGLIGFSTNAASSFTWEIFKIDLGRVNELARLATGCTRCQQIRNQGFFQVRVFSEQFSSTENQIAEFLFRSQPLNHQTVNNPSRCSIRGDPPPRPNHAKPKCQNGARNPFRHKQIRPRAPINPRDRGFVIRSQPLKHHPTPNLS
jgi:hypothetical protein